MARLRYLDSAKNDLIDIALYIARESGNRRIAASFVDKIRARCRSLAAPETSQRGTDRSELIPGLRSEPFGNYAIFFWYIGKTLEVVNIMEHHRDIAGQFSK